MKKIWLIASKTYKNRLRSGTFLILTFGLPVLMVIAGAIPFLMQGFGEGMPAIGYVDQTGRLADIQDVVEAQSLKVRAYNDTSEAQNAYRDGEISGYLLIPAGYFEGEQARYFGSEAPNESLTEGLRVLMRRAMLPQAPEWALDRLADPTKRTFIALSSGESVEEGPALIFRVVAPVGLALLLAFALLFTANQLGAAVVREKEQRAMEMIITSIRPIQLVAGKVLGMTLLSLTQLAVWGSGVVIALALLLAGDVDFRSLSVPWVALFWAVLLGIPGYFLYATIASGIGIIAGDSQQAQQLAGFLGFLGMVPFWFVGVIVEAPNSAPAIGLSLFPLTGPMFILLRMALAEVPLWQMIASLGILLLCLVLAVWAVARIFRAAMLMYGQSLRPGEIIRALRQS